MRHSEHSRVRIRGTSEMSTIRDMDNATTKRTRIQITIPNTCTRRQRGITTDREITNTHEIRETHRSEDTLHTTSPTIQRFHSSIHRNTMECCRSKHERNKSGGIPTTHTTHATRITWIQFEREPTQDTE